MGWLSWLFNKGGSGAALSRVTATYERFVIQADHAVAAAPAEAAGLHGAYSFACHVRQLAAELPGVRIVRIDEPQCFAVLAVQVHRDRYTAFLGLRGTELVVGMRSAFTFPRGRTPSTLSRLVEERKHLLGGHDLRLFHDDDGSSYFMTGVALHLDSVNSVTFANALRQMAPTIVGLDG